MNVRAEEQKFRSMIHRILNRNAHHMTQLIESSPYEDTNEAFDAVYSFYEVKVPIRIRENKYLRYQDFTIRSKAKHGGKTEIDKLREGFGDYYFYAWQTPNRKGFDSYLIVSLSKFRESGLINKPDFKRKNHDGTEFFCYSVADLHRHKCVVIFETLLS